MEERPALLASLARHMAEGVFAIDDSGRVLFMNAEAERLFGVAAADVVGRPAQETILHAPRCSFTAWADRQCMQQVCRREDETFVRADGSTFPVAFVTAPIREDEGVSGSVTVFHDITYFKANEEEQRVLIDKLGQTQAQLLQSEKMASIGQLAAGVAHEGPQAGDVGHGDADSFAPVGTPRHQDRSVVAGVGRLVAGDAGDAHHLGRACGPRVAAAAPRRGVGGACGGGAGSGPPTPGRRATAPAAGSNPPRPQAARCPGWS